MRDIEWRVDKVLYRQFGPFYGGTVVKHQQAGKGDAMFQEAGKFVQYPDFLI